MKTLTTPLTAQQEASIYYTAPCIEQTTIKRDATEILATIGVMALSLSMLALLAAPFIAMIL